MVGWQKKDYQKCQRCAIEISKSKLQKARAKLYKWNLLWNVSNIIKIFVACQEKDYHKCFIRVCTAESIYIIQWT